MKGKKTDLCMVLLDMGSPVSMVLLSSDQGQVGHRSEDIQNTVSQENWNKDPGKPGTTEETEAKVLPEYSEQPSS